eukprot:SAG22_NODE_18505_length_286_cov_0.823529_2_plen_45_part_00
MPKKSKKHQDPYIKPIESEDKASGDGDREDDDGVDVDCEQADDE